MSTVASELFRLRTEHDRVEEDLLRRIHAILGDPPKALDWKLCFDLEQTPLVVQ